MVQLSFPVGLRHTDRTLLCVRQCVYSGTLRRRRQACARTCAALLDSAGRPAFWRTLRRGTGSTGDDGLCLNSKGCQGNSGGLGGYGGHTGGRGAIHSPSFSGCCNLHHQPCRAGLGPAPVCPPPSPDVYMTLTPPGIKLTHTHVGE